jgi:hypothetical protein
MITTLSTDASGWYRDTAAAPTLRTLSSASSLTAAPPVRQAVFVSNNLAGRPLQQAPTGPTTLWAQKVGIW